MKQYRFTMIYVAFMTTVGVGIQVWHTFLR